MKITIECIFLFGVISAKTNPAHVEQIEKKGLTLPLLSLFLSYDELLCYSPELTKESLVQTLYELMAHSLIQCSFVGNGIYVSTAPYVSEIFHNPAIEVDCKRGPVMSDMIKSYSVGGA